MSFSADTDANCFKQAQDTKASGEAVVKTTPASEETILPEIPESTRFEKITVSTICVEDMISYPRRPVQRAALWRHRTSPWRKNTADERSGVDVWIAPKAAQKDLQRHVSFLSDRERARAQRMRHPSRRGGFEHGRILLRGALSHKVRGRVLPAHWQFHDEDGEKPAVDSTSVTPHFSISHTDVADIVVVNNGGPIGFDAENIFAKSTDIIGEALSAQERCKISGLQKHQQWPAFVRLWTFKEAYTKLLGVGMDVDFSTIEFDLDDPRLIAAPRNISGQKPDIFESFILQVDGNSVRMTMALGARQAAGSFDELRIHFVTNSIKSIQMPAHLTPSLAAHPTLSL